MPMKQTKNNDLDFEKRDINLLPELMRKEEDRVRKLQGTKERVYELREPKKQRRKRMFSWLPWFGGERWATPAQTAGAGSSLRAPDGAVQVEPPVPSDASGSRIGQAVSNDTSDIRAVPSSPPRVIPQLKREGHSWFGGGKSSGARSHHDGAAGSSAGVSRPITPSIPVSNAVQGEMPEALSSPNAVNASAQGMVPTTSHASEHLSAVFDERSGDSGHVSHGKHKLPRWLDIFHWLGFFSLRAHSRKPGKLKSVRQSGGALPQPLEVPRPSAPSLPPLPNIPQRPTVTAQPSTISPIFEATPEPQAQVSPQASAMPQTPQVHSVAEKPSEPPKAPFAQTPPSFQPVPVTPATQKTKENIIKDLKSRFHVPQKKSGHVLPGDSDDVNLIPGRHMFGRSWKELVTIIGVAILAAIILNGAGYGVLRLWQNQIATRTVQVDTDIQNLKQQLEAHSKKFEPEMTALGNRIDNVAQLLNRHIYWTNFFDLLEKYTLPDVYYDGVAAGTNGTFSLSAHGSSFATVSRQLMLLQSPEASEFVERAEITSATQSEGLNGVPEVAFAIQITLNPNLFYYDSAE